MAAGERWRRLTRFEAINLVAALPAASLATAYGLALFTPAFNAERPTLLYATMQVEFLVIHSFAFIGFTIAWKPERPGGRIARQGLFWGLIALYITFAFKSGWEGVAIFLSATLATYLGLLLNLKSGAAVIELAARWLFLFFLAMIVWALNDMPQDVGNWDRTERTLHSGIWYFGVIAAVELVGLFRSPALAQVPARGRGSDAAG